MPVKVLCDRRRSEGHFVGSSIQDMDTGTVPLPSRGTVPISERAELASLLQRYLEYRLEVRLRSPLVIQRLARS